MKSTIRKAIIGMLLVSLFQAVTIGNAAWAQKAGIARFVIKQGHSYGYINAKGQVVIKPQFSVAYPFNQNMGLVKKGPFYGYISTSGRFLISPRYGLARPFSGGLAAVRKGAKWGYITSAGKFRVRPSFSAAGDFSQGLAPVKKGRSWGYINNTGRTVIKQKFLDARSFSSGLAAVQDARSRKWGYINQKGSFVIRPQFAAAGDFSAGLAPASSGRSFGYINSRGQWKIRPNFADAHPFSDGLAAVKVGQNYGFIHTNGEMAIPARYQISSHSDIPPLFYQGLAPVFSNPGMKQTNSFSYVSSSGRMVWGSGAAAPAPPRAAPVPSTVRQPPPSAPPPSSGQVKGHSLGYLRVKPKSRRFVRLVNKMWPKPSIPHVHPPGVSHGSDVVLPPGFNKNRQYPAWIILPYTNGTTPEMLRYYVGYRRDLSLETAFALYLRYLYPDPSVREQKKFVVFLPGGRGSKADHSTRGFERAMQRYEQRAKGLLSKYGSMLNIDRSRVVIGGHSLGGDMGWALPIRNPDTFAGGIVLGSRANYRNDNNLKILKKRNFRYFLAMGDRDQQMRQIGQSKARSLLRQTGLEYAFFSIPGAKHVDVLTEGPLMAALDYVMLRGSAKRARYEPPPVPVTPPPPPPSKDTDATTAPLAAAVQPPRAATPPASGNDGRTWPPSPLAANGILIKDKMQRFPKLILKIWPKPRIPHVHPPGVSHDSNVVLPPGFRKDRLYPLWIIYPYTSGTSPEMLRNYIGRRRDLTMEQAYALFLEYVYPDPAERERKKFIIFLPAGRGSKRDHSWRGFERAMRNYENQVKAFLSRYGSMLNIDRNRVVIGGHSLGGDLSWALPLRNPRLFSGGIVMGSRASFREAENLKILGQRKFRYFFSIGGWDQQVRQSGQAQARGELQRAGVPYVFFKIPRSKHSTILPESALLRALEFTMFNNGKGLLVVGGGSRAGSTAVLPAGPSRVAPPSEPTARTSPAAPQPEPSVRIGVRRPSERLKRMSVVNPPGGTSVPGQKDAPVLEQQGPAPWPEPLVEKY